MIHPSYPALDAQWREAVAARDEHDARVRRVLASIPPHCVRGREQVRRAEGARRGHLTRTIVRIERAIDALRS